MKENGKNGEKNLQKTGKNGKCHRKKGENRRLKQENMKKNWTKNEEKKTGKN